MNAYPDTSFLWALYRRQANSPEAATHFAGLAEALVVSDLLLFEFRQSLRWQSWLHQHDKTKGAPAAATTQALADLESDLAAGALVVASVEWPEVFPLAEKLSALHTKASGHRAFDILHIATAAALGAREFLTFDANQRKLASRAGLKPRP